MPRKDIQKDGEKTRFSSTNQPEIRGRKPSALKFIRDEGVSITDIRRIIGSLIWEYDSEELAALLKPKGKSKNTQEKPKSKNNEGDKENAIPIPMGISLVLGALSDDLKNKSLVNFDKLMDRSYGKATQPVDIPPDTLTKFYITPEERRKAIEEMLKKCEVRPKQTGRKRTGKT